MHKKLLLIGWDAADWQVINPLIQEGKLPALRKLIENGCSGNIATLNPPLSPILWTSIATGKRAYDHGIYGFVQADQMNGTVGPIKAFSRKAKTFWNILNTAGLKTNIINWWPSHPAEKVDGICVSNFYHKDAGHINNEWPMDSSVVYPEKYYGILKELRLHPAELTLQHILPFIPDAEKLDPENDKVLKPLLRVLAQCSSVHNATTYLMQNTEWDVTAVYHEALDHFSHLAMKYHPPKQAGIKEEDFYLYKNVIEAAYRFHDMMLERLLKLAGADCNVIIVSDHGFQSGGLRVETLPDVPAAPAVEHRKYGVFAASGPEFKMGEKLYGLSLLDICPAILHLFDLPVGEDMEGRIPQDLFKDQRQTSYIPSWELLTKEAEFLDDEHSLSASSVKQLEDLGYINLPEKDKLQYVELELNYNRCISLIDGAKLEQAEKEASQLFEKHKDGRTALLLADVLLKNHKLQALQKHLNKLQQDHSEHPQLLYLEAQLKLRQGKEKEAAGILVKLEEKGGKSVQLFNEIGKSFLVSANITTAEKYFRKSLAMDPENATALSALAQCEMEKGQYESAVDLLNNSLDKLFYQPNAHYLLAISLIKLQYPQQALMAVKLCLKQAPHHEKALKLYDKMLGVKEEKTTVIIVSGLPRSGTSLMMQMLNAAGLAVLKDDKREGDEHNPKGYWEYEKVKDLGKDGSWISIARGKALKVVSPLLRYLPASENYRIIYLKRPLTEIIVSQQIMLGNKKDEVMQSFPFQLAVDLQKEEDRSFRWLMDQPNMKLMEVEYYDCLKEPEKVMKAINEFLDKDLNINSAVQVVNPNLHRNKLVIE